MLKVFALRQIFTLRFVHGTLTNWIVRLLAISRVPSRVKLFTTLVNLLLESISTLKGY